MCRPAIICATSANLLHVAGRVGMVLGLPSRGRSAVVARCWFAVAGPSPASARGGCQGHEPTENTLQCARLCGRVQVKWYKPPRAYLGGGSCEVAYEGRYGERCGFTEAPQGC